MLDGDWWLGCFGRACVASPQRPLPPRSTGRPEIWRATRTVHAVCFGDASWQGVPPVRHCPPLDGTTTDPLLQPVVTCNSSPRRVSAEATRLWRCFGTIAMCHLMYYVHYLLPTFHCRSLTSSSPPRSQPHRQSSSSQTPPSCPSLPRNSQAAQRNSASPRPDQPPPFAQ